MKGVKECNESTVYISTFRHGRHKIVPQRYFFVKYEFALQIYMFISVYICILRSFQNICIQSHLENGTFAQ